MSARSYIRLALTAGVERDAPAVGQVMSEGLPNLAGRSEATGDTSETRFAKYVFTVTADGTISIALATGVVTTSVATYTHETPRYVGSTSFYPDNVSAYAAILESAGVYDVVMQTKRSATVMDQHTAGRWADRADPICFVKQGELNSDQDNPFDSILFTLSNLTAPVTVTLFLIQ